MMKQLLFALFISTLAFGETSKSISYQEKIYELQRAGLLEEEDAKLKAFKLKLTESSDLETIKKTARGVAKALVNKTIIRIDNDPLEINIP
ncbi:MAG: hypothetical protein CME64_14120 [Halobacteriovoraceae bacterium]|nr:hypothetical protein [Halobacteriovoraceae bacterium]|tara:strand:- start:31547 stop:31819 length:273 start_codon:yes stop_codon:yes gene_type:complete